MNDAKAEAVEPVQLLALLKHGPKVLAGLALSALALLVLPESALATIGLEGIRKDHRGWIGAAFLVATVILIVQGVAWTGGEVRRRSRKKETQADLDAAAARERASRQSAEAEEAAKAERAQAEQVERGIAYLNQMTERERAVAREFIDNESRTCWLSGESGVVSELRRRGVIYLANEVGHYDTRLQAMAWDFTMRDWAWDYLHAHRDVLAKKKGAHSA
jgi:hypothetical protein